MSILSDEWLLQHQEIIQPFIECQVKLSKDGAKIFSTFLSSCGYDISLSSEKFSIFHNFNALTGEIDPKDFHSNVLEDLDLQYKGDGTKYFVIPPKTYALGYTIEYFNLPDNVAGWCIVKSTMARSALMLNVGIIEPGFRGNIVLEMFNASPFDLRVYAEEGIAQVVFFQLDRKSQNPYNSKYQGQRGLTLAKL